jgi:molybdenum cofactor biosynthesis protein B
MGAHEHHAKSAALPQVRCVVVTVSDTRTAADDVGGDTARRLLAEAGHEVVASHLLKDEPAQVAELVRDIARGELADAVVLTGGTGISRRDTTYEAVAALLDKRLDGFGELFRMLSYQEIGPAAMLSRAVAGLHAGLLVFATPGSPAAVTLAVGKLIAPELRHMAREVRR